MTVSNNDFDPQALGYDAVMRSIAAHIKPLQETELISLDQAHNRILAEPLRAPLAVPSHTNSAVDGYAFNHTHVDVQEKIALVGRSIAGHPYTGGKHLTGCVRITTGAVLPEWTDTVVMQENVIVEDGTVHIKRIPNPYQNVRYQGEDLKKGDVICDRGRRLSALEVSSIASGGHAKLRVFRRPQVAFFSTGDEVRHVGETLEVGEVYDSNRYLLKEVLQNTGASGVDLGVIADRKEAVAQALDRAADCDLAISTAGVSVGDTDFLSQQIQTKGELYFWKMALKPGRPLAFGRIRSCPFFALPGNPVSVAIMFAKIVLPGLRKLMGETEPAVDLRIRARLLNTIKKRPGRMEYQRGFFEKDTSGDLVVRAFNQQGSALLNNLTKANCLVVLPQESSNLEADSKVDIEPITWPLVTL